MVQAQWAAVKTGSGRFVTEQPSYSIPQRGVERDVLPVAREYGPGVMVWSPLASGWLSGAVRRDQEVTTNRAALMPRRFDLADPANDARMDAEGETVFEELRSEWEARSGRDRVDQLQLALEQLIGDDAAKLSQWTSD